MVTRDRPRQTMRAIESISRTASMPTELLVWDNASQPELRGWLQVQARAMRFTLFLSPDNIGYGAAHNEMARRGKGDFIVATTNDITFGRGWQEALMAPFRDQRVAQTCPVHIFNALTPAGVGCTMAEVPLSLRPLLTLPEYADGALFMIRRSLVQHMGSLFDPAFRLAYAEDADLSLRLRSRGYRVAAVEAVQFRRDESEKTPAPPNLKDHWNHNHPLLLARHGHYLSTRRFT